MESLPSCQWNQGMMCTNVDIAWPFSFNHVIRRVNLYCCYCCLAGSAVATAADSRSHAALLLLSCSSPAINQTHPPLLNNSGQATSRGNYSRQWATSGCNDDGNNSNRWLSTCCCWKSSYLAMWSNRTTELSGIMREWEPFWHSNSSGWTEDHSKKGSCFLKDWQTRVICPGPTIDFDVINAS